MTAATPAPVGPVTDWNVDGGGQFTDLRLLDRTGPTALYSATEAVTGRPVALKVLDSSAPPFIREAIDREAEYLAVLGTHPHIITMYQRTVLPDGRDALVLQACPSSAATAARESRLSVHEAVAMAIKVAGAIETVHHAGLVHCAVRPQNVLITEFDEPVLCDFAVAGPIGEPFVVGIDETTPHTAPELLLGEGPTPATDAYGLASTLYELISGRAAFRAYDGESPASVSLRVLAGGVRPIMAPDVPLELSDLLVWGMAVDPSERPPSAAWLAEELGRLEQASGWMRTKMVTGEAHVDGRRGRRR
jgi:serine/threonine protein kinase